MTARARAIQRHANVGGSCARNCIGSRGRAQLLLEQVDSTAAKNIGRHRRWQPCRQTGRQRRGARRRDDRGHVAGVHRGADGWRHRRQCGWAASRTNCRAGRRRKARRYSRGRRPTHNLVSPADSIGKHAVDDACGTIAVRVEAIAPRIHSLAVKCSVNRVACQICKHWPVAAGAVEVDLPVQLRDETLIAPPSRNRGTKHKRGASAERHAAQGGLSGALAFDLAFVQQLGEH